MNNIKNYIGKEVKVGNKEGEIVRVLGVQFLKVEFFNINDGVCTINVKDIEKHLV